MYCRTVRKFTVQKEPTRCDRNFDQKPTVFRVYVIQVKFILPQGYNQETQATSYCECKHCKK